LPFYTTWLFLTKNLHLKGNFFLIRAKAPSATIELIPPPISTITEPGATLVCQNSTAPFPLPIRVSNGFLVTGICGYTLNQSFPLRFNERFKVMIITSI
jgi:hypothetical protein